MKENKLKTGSDGEDVGMLELIAANTMCTRKAVGAAAAVAKTLIISGMAIIIAITVLALTPADRPVWVPFVCWGVIIVFGLLAVIYSLTVLDELEKTVDTVSENEERIFGGEEDQDN